MSRWIRQSRGSRRAPQEWQGALQTSYYLGSTLQSSSLPFYVRLRTFNEPKTSNIYNVVAAIPGAWESDRWEKCVSVPCWVLPFVLSFISSLCVHIVHMTTYLQIWCVKPTKEKQYITFRLLFIWYATLLIPRVPTAGYYY